MKNSQNKNILAGFTLVELIVVVSILSILSTIGFVSYRGFKKDARDATRTVDIKNIHGGLGVYLLKNHTLPDPINSVEVKDSQTTISKQGYVGADILDDIKLSEARDPLDNNYYTYAVNASKNKYQIMGFFELGQNSKSSSFLLEKTYADDLDYSTRVPKAIGARVAIVLKKEKNLPITENLDIAGITGTDSIYQLYSGGKSMNVDTNDAFKQMVKTGYPMDCKYVGSDEKGLYKMIKSGEPNITTEPCPTSSAS